MDPFIIVVLLVGLYTAWNIGANDTANSVGTSVGSGVLTMRGALVRIIIFDSLGAILFGSHVTKTIGKGIVDVTTLPDQLVVIGAFSVVLSAGIWLTIATWKGLPVSTTHSTVGAMLGFGLIAAGYDNIKWSVMRRIVASWVVSPLIGAVLAFILYTLLIKKVILSRTDNVERVEKVFGYLQVSTAMYVGFAFGSNDVANAVGPIFMMLSRKGYDVNFNLLLGLGAFGIVLGAMTWGYKVIETIGKRVTEITPTRGFVAEFAAASVIIANSFIGLPISTTHTVVGCVIGVGLARGVKALNLGIIYRIIGSWFLTVPVAALLTVGIFKIVVMLV
ncbi:MAG: inorganic phosphate transporter [Candidatus Hydrothermarchaeales archaeon]